MELLCHISCLLLSLVAAATAAEDPKPAQHHRTDWLKEAKWGVFMHYMGGHRAQG
jgi:hypothetical protein